MYLLGIDFETTGLDVKEARIIEFGLVLWDWKNQTPKTILGGLVWEKTREPLTEEIKTLTGLNDEMFKTEHTFSPESCIGSVLKLSENCDFLIGHNANNFDKPLLEQECIRVNKKMPEKPWLDTREDVQYPEHIQSRKLVHLAAEHGFVNPFSHRAVFDVLTMFKVLQNYDLDEIIRLSKEPTLTVVAQVNFNNKDAAKARKYAWDGENKYWYKKIKESLLEKEIKEANFKVVVQK
jgi:DNA polymerase-3 subunit epsilon